jgi:hypothetical protein
MGTKLLNPVTFYRVNLENATRRGCIKRIGVKNNKK